MGQCAVPILPNDNALQVFNKVTVAAEITLNRVLPDLLNGTATMHTQDLAAGSYFGGRSAKDGVIDWQNSAQNIHNLVRAVAPPYPGATTTVMVNGTPEPLTITRTLLSPQKLTHQNPGYLNVSETRVIALCGDGRMLRVLEAEFDGQLQHEIMLSARLGAGLHQLGASA